MPTTRVTTFTHDFRGRRIATDGELDFYEKRTYDNLDRVTAIPGELSVSGACGGVQFLGWEDTQVSRRWRSSFGVWCSRIGKGCCLFTFHAASGASFKHFGVDVDYKTWWQATRELHDVVGKRL